MFPPSGRNSKSPTTTSRQSLIQPNRCPSPGRSKGQPKDGRITGFDFARDPLNAPKPFTTLAEVMKMESEQKPKVMEAQRRYLEAHYELAPRHDPHMKMTRGKPIFKGPTAKLASGLTWEQLGAMSAVDIKKQNAFPYPSLPYSLHTNGGQVFPQMQIKMFPRLERYDVDFNTPEAFLPEFPPAIFLQQRPELGDVSRGQVVHLGNFRELFKENMTPVQLEGMRLLLTPIPQEEFNLTDDRKSPQPQQGGRLFRLSREWPHDRSVPLESGHPAARSALPAGYSEPPRSLQPADPRFEAQPEEC